MVEIVRGKDVTIPFHASLCVHPAYHPSPSSVDLRAIQKIAKDQSYRCQ
ncbi:hypothetical protein [Ruixingdingia sedimenti]|uniref:Uncharacterized protein n=1 Tax=Ruixingdingia sedimenti TaxID=3073604 RepID=A0ABU1FAJ3_9RHOB|nr:hypothetical protein [Xinfangfangia sp. LG-4]MDR5653857.1 hypothetical protein [Xinfangfangia sp. LG-4]